MTSGRGARVWGGGRAFILCVMVAGCAASPPARMDAWLGPDTKPGTVAEALPASVEAGLVLINDTADPKSAPAISESGLAFLTDQVRTRLERDTPVRIATVAPGPGLQPSPSVEPLLGLARARQESYLLVAIFSGAESERPVSLPLDGHPEQGGRRPSVQGFEDVNYALAELALLDVRTGQVLARAHGRAWMTLHRLYVPVKSNAYPVIHRSQRVAPIYPTEENAHDVLRSLAADEALEQAVMYLQKQWK